MIILQLPLPQIEMIKLYGLNSNLGIIGMSFIITKESYIFLASLVLNLLTIVVVWQKRHKAGMIWLALAIYSTDAFLMQRGTERQDSILQAGIPGSQYSRPIRGIVLHELSAAAY